MLVKVLDFYNLEDARYLNCSCYQHKFYIGKTIDVKPDPIDKDCFLYKPVSLVFHRSWLNFNPPIKALVLDVFKLPVFQPYPMFSENVRKYIGKTIIVMKMYPDIEDSFYFPVMSSFPNLDQFHPSWLKFDIDEKPAEIKQRNFNRYKALLKR